ncbi:hypothetical protein N7471_001376 [Penicillium samsonianum]|uniref:uncharacterized protein n=1 Tax=Penicillium samsonianum TaxID=1882272 RepID=UPI002547AF3E|nr:uncharacterized protein N7471_001376 [Penicillium samsonianum]KAJ6150177.1 hypothetical protein N7471_001376 [Penicillium samsonianum]
MAHSEPITLYTSATPNGFKISITLEELGLSYKTRPVDLQSNEQKEEWFLKFNPNGRLPAITDGETRVFESGAIMLYLVEKYDTERKISYAPEDTPGYSEQLSWLMWQMAGLGPMQGQAHHFTGFAPVRSDWGIQRYVDETKRLYMVLNTRLGELPYVAGQKFTIADIASFCWVRASPNILGFSLDDWPAIRKWYDLILARETVQKALKIPEPKMTEAQFAVIVAGKRKEMLERKNTDLS